jgi:hypothetical protein
VTHDPTELEVLVEQLDELLAEGATHPDEALEIATVAGLAARLGAPAEVLAGAEAWRDGPGEALLQEAFEDLDADPYVEALDDVTSGSAEDEEVDEALSDFDDLVAAAAWAGRPEAVRKAARRVAQIVRTVPEPFAFLAPDARTMSRTRTVAEDPDLYDYWLAIADAAAWAE